MGSPKPGLKAGTPKHPNKIPICMRFDAILGIAAKLN